LEHLQTTKSRDSVQGMDETRRRTLMTRAIRRRIVRAATPEEEERHRTLREQIRQEMPELEQKARESAARHQERAAIGTVFTEQETAVVDAIDHYATTHSLVSRGDVVREALAHLLGIDIPRQ